MRRLDAPLIVAAVLAVALFACLLGVGAGLVPTGVAGALAVALAGTWIVARYLTHQQIRASVPMTSRGYRRRGLPVGVYALVIGSAICAWGGVVLAAWVPNFGALGIVLAIGATALAASLRRRTYARQYSQIGSEVDQLDPH